MENSNGPHFRLTIDLNPIDCTMAYIRVGRLEGLWRTVAVGAINRKLLCRTK